MRFATLDDELTDEHTADFLCNSDSKNNFRADHSLMLTPRRKRSTLGPFDSDLAEHGLFDTTFLKSLRGGEDSLFLSPAPMDAPSSHSGHQSPPLMRNSISHFFFPKCFETPLESPLAKRVSIALPTAALLTPLPEESSQLSDPSEPSALNVSQEPSKKPQKRAAHGGCNCRNTKCLRLNCKCFKTLGYCGDGCACLDCLNRKEFAEVREFVVEKTREINQAAFQPKAVPLTEGTDVVVNSRGCSCRTGCRKNYCECFRLGTGCSPICRCADCQNEKVALEKQQVVDYMHVSRRTKHKIIIEDCVKNFRETAAQPAVDLDVSSDPTESSKLNARGFSVAFQRYKRVKSSPKDSGNNSVQKE